MFKEQSLMLADVRDGADAKIVADQHKQSQGAFFLFNQKNVAKTVSLNKDALVFIPEIKNINKPTVQDTMPVGTTYLVVM